MWNRRSDIPTMTYSRKTWIERAVRDENREKAGMGIRKPAMMQVSGDPDTSAVQEVVQILVECLTLCECYSIVCTRRHGILGYGASAGHPHK
jgi:hypothetical protein